MDDKMSENIILDSKRMFEHACAFCDCAKFCEVESSNIEYRMRSHTVSGIVNSAFACEIFIKTLLVFHGRTIMDIKGHELKLLWEKFKKEDYETAMYVEKGNNVNFRPMYCQGCRIYGLCEVSVTLSTEN